MVKRMGLVPAVQSTEDVDINKRAPAGESGPFPDFWILIPTFREDMNERQGFIIGENGSFDPIRHHAAEVPAA